MTSSRNIHKDINNACTACQRTRVRATPLPPQLREYCKLTCSSKDTQSLSLLSASLTSALNTSSEIVARSDLAYPEDTQSEIVTYVPSHSIITLLTTIAIHPSFTSPHASAERQAAAISSLHYLHRLNNIVGPLNVPFARAFQSEGAKRGSSRRSGGLRSVRDSSSSSVIQPASRNEDFDPDEDLQDELAENRSIWALAQDFWHVLGWSFNCAAKNEQRWIKWKLWLELIVGILEDDWFERLHASNDKAQDAKYGNSKDTSENWSLENSLIVQLANTSSPMLGEQGQVPLRRILRALFATGQDKELNEFGEVWHNELRGKPKEKDRMTPLKAINVEEGEFGDYADEESLDDKDYDDIDMAEASTQERKEASGRSRRKRKSGTNEHANPSSMLIIEAPAMIATISIRRRLINLMLRMSETVPLSFVSMNQFLDLLEEHMRSLPLRSLISLIKQNVSSPTQPQCQHQTQRMPSQRDFTPTSHIALLQEIVRPLLIGSGSSASGRRTYYLEQADLEKLFLPFASGGDGSSAANSKNPLSVVVSNAKFSFCLENMMRLLHAHIGLSARNGSLNAAVEAGIRARDEKTKTKAADKPEAVEARQWLESSHARLRLLVRMISKSPIQ